MEIKLIVIDIDGTLLDAKGSLSAENRSAIHKAKKQGVQVVLCTGRPIRSAQYLLAELDLLESDDLIITSNGGLIQKAKTGEIIHEVTFKQEESLAIYQLGQSLKMPITFIDLDYVYEPEYPPGAESLYTGGQESGLEFVALKMDELPEPFAIQQIIMSRPETELDAVIPLIPETFYESFNIYKSLPTLLEFLPKRVDKSIAMKLVGKKLDIEQKHIMGIGDHENDLSLVRDAGIGVAMANAVDVVQEAADYITKSNDAHGVAHAIEKFVLSQKKE